MVQDFLPFLVLFPVLVQAQGCGRARRNNMKQPNMFQALAALAVIAASAALAGPAPRDTITPAFREVIPNIPGKSLVAWVVSYPPGGKTSAHRHASSAFVTGYVLSGSIRSQVDSGKPQVYRTGESWTEPPGAQHRVSENASTAEPASLLAIYVVDSNTKDSELTTLEQP
jgi:quercetin dioxygenase-like cupin family protein